MRDSLHDYQRVDKEEHYLILLVDFLSRLCSQDVGIILQGLKLFKACLRSNCTPKSDLFLKRGDREVTLTRVWLPLHRDENNSIQQTASNSTWFKLKRFRRLQVKITDCMTFVR